MLTTIIISLCLTHWGQDKMAVIFRTIFSNAFSWMKMYEFRLNCHWRFFLRVHLTIFQQWFRPGGGTPYVMGDTYVPRFWPPFFTLAGSSTIFLGYFFSSTNTKTIFWGIKTTNSYRIRSFRPQISFFPRSFWVQFSAASGTPPSFFGPSTPPRGFR